MISRETVFLVTCEHASNRVPGAYESLFRGRRALVRSHRGWDPGAKSIAERMARCLDARLLCGRYTRLLVDLNRSPGNPGVFGAPVRGLPRGERSRLLAHHHAPHWERVRAAVAAARGRRVIHLAVHTFVSALDGRERSVDIGLLYDPGRVAERNLCRVWKRRLVAVTRGLRIRRNAPYRGCSDGLTTMLRRDLPPRDYLGLELEVSQGLRPMPPGLPALLARTLQEAVCDT